MSDFQNDVPGLFLSCRRRGMPMMYKAFSSVKPSSWSLSPLYHFLVKTNGSKTSSTKDQRFLMSFAWKEHDILNDQHKVILTLLMFFFCVYPIFLVWYCECFLNDLAFSGMALGNEDQSTEHPNLENEAPKSRKRSTKISKTKHPNLETTVLWRTTTLSLAWRKPNQVEAMDASAPPKVHQSKFENHYVCPFSGISQKSRNGQ